MATNGTPQGCGPNVDSLYYNLCDLGAVWGVAVEGVAAAGIVLSFVLFVSLLASLPFMNGASSKRPLALQVGFLLFTAGLLGLSFAFVVGKDFATCASRRFLFGVLFGGCFACHLMESVRLNVLARGGSEPRRWGLCLGALALWLVEVVINTEWLIITVVRHPLAPLNASAESGRATATPCNIANQDFVMALIYVMALILTVAVASLSVMAGKHAQWKKEGALILITSLLSVGIWVAWVVMYVYGNKRTGGPTWDDPTLAIALVANGWLFLILYIIPQFCFMSSDCEQRPDDDEEAYANRVGYETILKEQSSQNMFMENKAFSMDEPSQASKPVSPYSGYTGQQRSAVYQPTELALISKQLGNHAPAQACDMIIPRASAGSAANSGSSTPSAPHQAGNAARTPQPSGHGLTRTAQW
ncbi:G-protein coupled receptor family C group 5 member C isoform 1-T3 [Odontesthes bonariensis]|uniref:G-protein coupled receptor family C group 5 member C n=1 Tax=Odontesthes bonariensis TaxID=219752 RepID=UPI003F58CB3E